MIARTTGGSWSTSATAASETKRSRCIPGVGFVGRASDATPFGLLMCAPFERVSSNRDAVVLLGIASAFSRDRRLRWRPMSLLGGHQLTCEEIQKPGGGADATPALDHAALHVIALVLRDATDDVAQHAVALGVVQHVPYKRAGLAEVLVPRRAGCRRSGRSRRTRASMWTRARVAHRVGAARFAR